MMKARKGKPAQPDLGIKEGLACMQAGDYQGALARFNEVLRDQPRNPDALAGRGRALGQLGRHQEAAQAFARALTVRPDHADYLSNYGVSLHKLGRDTEALRCFEKALAAVPDHPVLLTNRGFLLQSMGRLEEALRCLDRAIARAPGSCTAMHSRGMVLEKLGLHEKALAQFDAVLDVDPEHVNAWCGRGVALSRLGRRQQSRMSYEQALRRDPGNVDTLFNLSFLQLAEGDLLQGFRGQALRWTSMWPRLDARTDRPIWLGQEPLSGKTVLLHHEQGFGDTIQLARFVPLVAALAGGVLLRVPRSFIGLLSTLRGGAQLVAEGDPLPPHDFHCPLMLVPAALGTTLETIPAPRTYLAANSAGIARWAERLGTRGRPRVGIAWSGHPQYPLRAERDMPFAHLSALWDLPFELISLQKEVSPEDQAALDAQGIARHGEALTDFADTAALIHHLDLVISVDTAVAHLAGALGRPVWILNRHVPCWRWLIDRSDSPWYPSARLFQQASPGDWPGLMAQVREAADLWGRQCVAA